MSINTRPEFIAALGACGRCNRSSAKNYPKHQKTNYECHESPSAAVLHLAATNYRTTKHTNHTKTKDETRQSRSRGLNAE